MGIVPPACENSHLISRWRANDPDNSRLVTVRVVSCGTSITAGEGPTPRRPPQAGGRGGTNTTAFRRGCPPPPPLSHTPPQPFFPRMGLAFSPPRAVLAGGESH